MRFDYSPQIGQLSVYASQDEFQLAASQDSYRVIVKTLRNKNGDIEPELIAKFIEEYSEFVKKILQSIYPEEKIKDIVVMSTMPKFGFLWTSLLDIKKCGNSFNFFEMMMNYITNIIKDSGSKNRTKELEEILEQKDLSKLEILNILSKSIDGPSIWKNRKKQDNNKLKNITDIKNINIKIQDLEKKYQFSSEEMYKFYQEYKGDESLEPGMLEWIDLFEERRFLLSIKEKHRLLDELLDKWDKIEA